MISTNETTIGTDVYIDDVSLIELDLPAWAGPDHWQVPGDSSYIGREPELGLNAAGTWYQLPNMAVPLATVAGLWVKPVQTSTYVLQQNICGRLSADTVVVYASGLGLAGWEQANAGLSVYPLPARDYLHLAYSGPGAIVACHLYNSLGARVSSGPPGSDGRLALPGLPPGLYQLQVELSNQLNLRRRVLVEHQLYKSKAPFAHHLLRR